MNRVTRLLHKARFLSRHRYLLAYSHKYVISADDLTRPPQIAEATGNNQEVTAEKIDELLKDFDAEKNETDRRIYYEVIGKEIGNDKPDNRDSSDEEWGLLGAPDLQFHAFS